MISISNLYFPFTYEGEDTQDYLYYGHTEFFGMNTGLPLRIDMANLPKADKPQVEESQPEKAGTVDESKEEKSSDGDPKVVNIFPEYYLIEVGHFQNIIRRPIDEWVYLFKNSEVQENFHSKNIQAAKEKLMFLHMSEEERTAYKQFQLSRASALDVLSGQYNEGVKDGIEIGKEQGIEEGMARTLRELIPLMAQMRFGNTLPADLSVRLQQASLATLQQLQATLATSASLEAWLA